MDGGAIHLVLVFFYDSQVLIKQLYFLITIYDTDSDSARLSLFLSFLSDMIFFLLHHDTLELPSPLPDVWGLMAHEQEVITATITAFYSPVRP